MNHLSRKSTEDKILAYAVATVAGVVVYSILLERPDILRAILSVEKYAIEKFHWCEKFDARWANLVG